jgi:acyl-coenzyme A thioesterase PaaI-like protein
MPHSTPAEAAPSKLDDLARLFGQIKQSVALGIPIILVKRGSALLQLPYSDGIIGDQEIGTVHGGGVTTLMDSAAGCAVLSVTPEG